MIVVLKIIKKLAVVLRERKVFAYSGLYISALWVVSSIVFHRFENVSLFDSLYWAITTTTTVGYGDITPKTDAGKLLSIFVMISGIGVLGVLLASMAEVMIEKGLKRRPKVSFENHVVALGWNGTMELAVKELLKEGIEVVVVSEEELPVEHAKLLHVKGSPIEEDTLKRAGIEKARFAIICGKDDETLLAAIAVRKISENLDVACVVSDQRVKRALETLGVDKVLSINELSGLFLCRSIFAPRISSVFRELMSTEGMDVFENKIDGVKGLTFEELILKMKERKNALAIGIIKDGKILLNPEGNVKLSGEEEIIYIARDRVNEV